MKVSIKNIPKREVKKVIFGILISTFVAISFSLVFVLVPRNSLVVTDQPIGHDNIYIKRLSLVKPGFVVIKARKTIYRHSDYLPAGVYTDINLDLFGLNSVPEVEPKQGDSVFVILYQDNGDTFFDQFLDEPIMRFNGKPLEKRIILK